MSRKPVNIQSAEAKGRPYGRRAVWAHIREKQVFSRIGLRLALPHVGQSVIDDYLTALLNAGYVRAGELCANPNGNKNKVRQYELVRDTGVDAPRLKKDGTPLPPTGQQVMWQMMQIRQSFTATELAALAGTEDTPVAVSAAEDYLLHLRRAGYLIIVRSRAASDADIASSVGAAPSLKGGRPPAPAGGHKERDRSEPVYRLIRDTGGYAPLIQRTKVVFDPNLNCVVWHGEIDT